MSFERVGIARYARCERLLASAPTVLGDRWDELPAELRARWVRMLTHCRRARLMAYRVVEMQSTGQVRPGDAAAYRIAVTKLDQDSAEVLSDIAAEVSHDDPRAAWFLGEVEDHWRYSQASTVSRQHRDAADPVVPLAPGRCQVILDLSDDAKEYGRQALRAFEAAGGDELVQQAEAKPEDRAALIGPVLDGLGAFDLDPRTDADGLEAAAALKPQRGILGPAVPGGRTAVGSDRSRGRRSGGGLPTCGPRPHWAASKTIGRLSLWTASAARSAESGRWGRRS